MTTRTHRHGLLLATIIATLPSAAMANDGKERARFGVAATAGTLGAGAQVRGELHKHVALRVDATVFGLDMDYNSSQIRYDGSVRLKSAGVMAEFYPTGGGFFLAAGVRYNRNRANAVGTPTGNVTFNGRTYTPAQVGTVTGGISVPEWAPALTIGYRKRSRGLALGIEGGVMFQGAARVSPLTSSTGLLPQADLDAEQASLQTDVGKYKIYPIVQASIGYNF
jgi:hypothetical protein